MRPLGPCPAGCSTAAWSRRDSRHPCCATPRWPGSAPGKGCCVPQRGCRNGHCAPAPTASTPGPRRAPAQPPGLLLGPLPSLGGFEPADDSDLRSWDLFTRLGWEERARARPAAWRPCGTRRAPQHEPLRVGCSTQSGCSLDPPSSIGPLGRDMPGLSRGGGGCPRRLLRRRRLRLPYPLLAGSAQQILFSLFNLNAAQSLALRQPRPWRSDAPVPLPAPPASSRRVSPGTPGGGSSCCRGVLETKALLGLPGTAKIPRAEKQVAALLPRPRHLVMPTASGRAHGTVPSVREGRWVSPGLSRRLPPSRCHREACGRAGRRRHTAGKLLWALGFSSLQPRGAGAGPRGLFRAHAPRLVLADPGGCFLLHSLHHSRLVCHQVLTLC